MTRLTGTPTRRAAAGSPPSAKICLPSRVYAEQKGDNGKTKDGKGSSDRDTEDAPEGQQVEAIRHTADRHQRIEQRNALYYCSDRKRHDERMNAQQQYQRSVHHADGETDRQHRSNHGRGDIGIAVDHARKQGRCQRDIGIEREVDASRQNDHSLPERDKSEPGRLLEYIDGVVEAFGSFRLLPNR